MDINSVSLMNGLKFNEHKKMYEGMQSMHSNIAPGMQSMHSNEMDMFERNRITQQEIEDDTMNINKKYEVLFNKFDNIKNKLNSSIKTYISNDIPNKTIKINNNTLQHIKQNVFVTEPGDVSVKDATFIGCYNDGSSRAIQDKQSEGYVFDVDSCAQRAIDQGKTVFGIQNITKDGVAQCFIGDDLTSAKQYGDAYNTKHYWYAKNNKGFVKGAKLLKLFSNGVMMLFKTDDVSTNDDDILFSTYRDDSGKMAEGCDSDTGGKIQNIVASYGMNCLSNNYETTGEAEKPFIGNYTPYFKHLMGMDKGVYNVKFENGDPAKGCRKDFDVSYSCGNGKTKIINIPGPSDGKPISLDCTDEAKLCTDTRMIIQNDANLVILDGNNNLLWQSNTALPDNVGDRIIQEWLDKSLNKRDYLKINETMKPGDILTSKNGKNIVAFDKGGYLILICSNGNKCKVVDNKTYGVSGVNSVYSLPKSNIKNLGNIAYIDDNGIRYSYPNFKTDETTDLDDNTFITIGNYNSFDQDISSFSATSIQECETAASKNPDCGGFVFNSTTQRCSLKGKTIWPKSQRIMDKNCIMKIKAFKIQNDPSCSKTINAINSSQFELYPDSQKEIRQDYKCGLANFIDNNNSQYTNENNNLMNELEILINEMNELSNKRNSNINQIPNLRNKIQSRLDEYNKLRKEYNHYFTRQNDKTISQYKLDSQINKQMYNTDSTLLALLGIGGLLLTFQLMK